MPRMVRSSLLLVIAAYAGVACSSNSAEPEAKGVACVARPLVLPAEDFFTDISAPSGIQDQNFVANPATPIPINDHSRLAFADLDGDGFDDIVAHSLYPNAQQGIPFEHLVFLNNRDKTFRNFSDESGLRAVQAGHFAFADVDNDGDQDCFAGLDIALTGQTSALYLNDGKGHFAKKDDSGLAKIASSAQAVFGDFNGDGKLDVYSGNGGSSAGVADQLFFGNGDGTFTDVSLGNLKNRPRQPTNGLVACDYDDDGDLDIFVSHYGVSLSKGWNALWQNDGGVFTNVAVSKGFHAQATGNYWLATTGNGATAQPGAETEWIGSNGFGLDCQDIDGDGFLDVWLATISHPVDSDLSRKWSDPSQLLINKGPASGFAFENQFLAKGLPFNEGDIDAAAVDFDNDGRIDLAVTRDKKYETAYSAYDQQAWFGLMRQLADGTFESLGQVSGINDRAAPAGKTARMKAGQNLGWSDIDHDGDLDLLVGGRDNGDGGRANFLFENTLGQKNGWLGVRVRGDGVKINRDAIGARVTLRIGDKKYVREVRSTRGTYSSADQRTLLFGLGEAACVGSEAKVSLEVRWPNGETKTFATGTFPLDGYLTLDYTTGLAK